MNIRRYRRWLRLYAGEVPRELELAIDRRVAEVEERSWKWFGPQGGEVDEWLMDQTSGKLRLVRTDGRRVRGSARIVGSLANGTWRWSWANESIIEARRGGDLRALGEARGWSMLVEPEWSADAFDGWAMTALAAHGSSSAAYCAIANERAVFLLVDELKFAWQLFPRRSRSQLEDVFGLVGSAMNPALPQLEADAHREIQRGCDEALHAIESGEGAGALARLDAVWAELPDNPWDTAPSGWIQCARAAAMRALGDPAGAARVFEEAVIHRAIGLPKMVFVEWGVALQDAGDSRAMAVLLRGWIKGGALAFTSHPAALAHVEARVRELRASRPNEPRALIAAFGAALAAYDESATERMERAAVGREQESTMTAEELALGPVLDEEWCAILAAFSTPGKTPSCPGWGMHHRHAPGNETIETVEERDGSVIVRTHAADEIWSSTLEYRLVKDGGVLCIEQMWSIDGERVALLD